MGSLKTYLELCRISNLPTVWTNVLTAALLSVADLGSGAWLQLALSLSCFYMAGMSLNDLCDINIDRRERPSRPLPSGRISRRAAVTLTLTLFTLGLALLIVAPYPQAAGAGLLLILAIVFYDYRHKQNPYSPLVMASCRFPVFIATAIALTGRVNAQVLTAGGIQFGYVVLISQVARYENNRGLRFPFPVIPAMLAGISLLDGLVAAIFVTVPWFFAGMAGAALTWAAQRYVRGD